MIQLYIRKIKEKNNLGVLSSLQVFWEDGAVAVSRFLRPCAEDLATTYLNLPEAGDAKSS